MDFSDAPMTRRRKESGDGGSGTTPDSFGKHGGSNASLLSSLAHHHVAGNVVTDVKRLQLDFDKLCDPESTRWDDKSKRCVASHANAGGALCAPGSEAIATMCRKKTTA